MNFFFGIRHYRTKGLKHYGFAALFAACAALTRYIGYALIVTFFAYTLFFLYARRGDRRISAGKYLLLNGISYIPSLLYLIRNYVIWQTFHGPRVTPQRTLFYNLEQTFSGTAISSKERILAFPFGPLASRDQSTTVICRPWILTSS